MRKFSHIFFRLLLLISFLAPVFAQAATIHGPETYTANKKKWFNKKKYCHRSCDYFTAPKKSYKAKMVINKLSGGKLDKGYLALNHQLIPLPGL